MNALEPLRRLPSGTDRVVLEKVFIESDYVLSRSFSLLFARKCFSKRRRLPIAFVVSLQTLHKSHHHGAVKIGVLAIAFFSSARGFATQISIGDLTTIRPDGICYLKDCSAPHNLRSPRPVVGARIHVSPAQCPAEKSSSELSWAVPTWPVHPGPGQDSFYVATAFDPRRGTRGFVPRLAIFSSRVISERTLFTLSRSAGSDLEKDIETAPSSLRNYGFELSWSEGRSNKSTEQASQDCQA